MSLIWNEKSCHDAIGSGFSLNRWTHLSGIGVGFDVGQGLCKTGLHVLQGRVAGRLGAPGWWGRFGAVMGLLGIVALGGKVGNNSHKRGSSHFVPHYVPHFAFGCQRTGPNLLAP